MLILFVNEMQKYFFFSCKTNFQMFLSEQFNTTHFGNLHTNYFCSLVLHSLPCE